MSVFGRSYGQKISRGADQRQAGRRLHRRVAIKSGLAYVTEDRKQLGLVLINNVMHNTTLANHKGISKNFVIDEHVERKAANEYRQKPRIRTPSIYQDVVNLSGGNQQKVALGQVAVRQPGRADPRRADPGGIDVGAKYEIYTINDLVAAGKAVIFISSEMPELLGNLRPHLRHERRRDRGRDARRRG